MARRKPSPTASAADDVCERIGRERLLALYRRMLTIRRFEERTIAEYRKKNIAGFLHPYIGTEAVATGIFDHLDLSIDWTVTTYRCHAHAILHGLPLGELMAELFGKVTGNVRGKGGSMHFFSRERHFLGGHGIVGGQTPVGTGAAFSCKYGKTGGLSVTFMGDGAVAQGTFHESLNLASLWDLPAIYVIENNQWGMGTACGRAVAVEHMAETKAAGYRVEGFTVDGTDLFAVWDLFHRIVPRVRELSRPVLVEAKTVRFTGHSVSDSQPYRTRDQVEALRASRDVIDRSAAALLDAGWAGGDDLEAIDEQVRDEVAEATRFAEESPVPPIKELLRHVLAGEEAPV